MCVLSCFGFRGFGLRVYGFGALCKGVWILELSAEGSRASSVFQKLEPRVWIEDGGV